MFENKETKEKNGDWSRNNNDKSLNFKKNIVVQSFVLTNETVTKGLSNYSRFICVSGALQVSLFIKIYKLKNVCHKTINYKTENFNNTFLLNCLW